MDRPVKLTNTLAPIQTDRSTCPMIYRPNTQLLPHLGIDGKALLR